MSFVSKGHSINCNSVTLGGIYADSSESINIRHSDPNKKILVNGIEPGGGGGVSDPLNLNNINAAVAMTTQSIAPLASGGGLVIRANGLLPPEGAGETLNINASTVMTMNGDISTMNGNVQVQGTGAITCGTTINAVGNITTNVTGDINSGRDFIFNGQDLYKSYPGVVPAIPNKTYKDYKGLVATSDNAIFTAEPVFRKTIKVQTSDGAVPPVLTDQITLNSNGTIQCANINNVNEITTGTVVCDNGPTNECKARVFNTRTSGTNGWSMSQNKPSEPAVFSDNILQFTASQAGSFITVASSDYNASGGGFPSIIIDPVTVADGGRISCAEQIFGTTANRFIIKQDNGGVLDNHLQISAGSASSEVRFRDDGGQSVLRVGKTAVTLGNTIPLNFGLYSFRPQQYSRDITLTIDGTKDTTNFTNMIFNPRNSPDTWTNVNSGATNQTLYNAALVGYYKCTVTQTGLSSAGNFEGIKVICDYVLQFSQQSSPDIQPPITYGYTVKPSGGQAPYVEVDHTNVPVQSQPVFLLFPNQNTGETMPMTVKLTKMDY
jgi:hypothetical protein